MKPILTYILVMLSFGVSAQIIDNRECQAFTDDPFFYETFIKTNKIKAMRGVISTKKKLESIQSRGLETYYRFDEEGKLMYQYSTSRKSNGKLDTTIISYFYDDAGKILTKRRSDSYGFYSYNYQYDSLGLKVAESYCRDINKGPSKHEFELGKQFVIVNETFSNVWETDKKLIRKYFNNYGRPYQEVRYTWDEQNYLVEEETVLLLNKKRRKTVYEYDGLGRVVKKTQSSNVNGNSSLTYEYSYDDVGNLLESDEYRDGVHTTKRSILYKKESMLIKAIIVQDVDSEFMSLVKYEFDFYE